MFEQDGIAKPYLQSKQTIMEQWNNIYIVYNLIVGYCCVKQCDIFLFKALNRQPCPP